MNRNSTTFVGVIFILLGSLFMVSNLGFINISWSYLWPLTLLVPGLYMHYAFFSGTDKNPGILVPGGILTTYGILFYLNVFLGWHMMGSLWPLFLIGIAIGLSELYLFGKRDKALLIPIAILGGLGLSFLSRSFFFFDFRRHILPVLFIIIGVLLIIKRDKRVEPEEYEEKPVEMAIEKNDTDLKE